MKDIDFWFQLGSDKSGTNLLRLSLDARSDCAAPGPFHVLERVFSQIGPSWDVRREGNWQKLVDNILKSKTWASSKLHLSAEDLAKLSEHRELGSLFVRLYQVHAEAKGASHIFVKEHDLHRH